MKNKFIVPSILIVILILGFVVRLYKLNNPVADWHSWRQADTSAVSRDFVSNGFDLLHPTFEDLSNVPSGKDNPHGYRFVEFPIYNVAQAGLTKLSASLTLEEWGRIVTILSSLLAAVFLYLLVYKYAGMLSALFAAFFYTFLPYSIYYSRTILPDPMAVMAILGGMYFFDKSLDKKKINVIFLFVSLLFTAAAFLLKPYTLFFVLPFIYIAWTRYYLGFLKKWQLWVFMILAVLPLVWWRWWIMQYPEGIPVSDWLLNGGNIRFTGAYFYWIFADRIGRLILGYWGLIIFGFGLLSISRRTHFINNGFFYANLASMLLYVVVIARGNVQHDYYQIYIIPTIAMFLGLGSSLLISMPKDFFSRPICYVILAISIIFSLSFGWYFVRDYYNINNPSIVAAGAAINQLTPKDAKIIANYNGDTSLLYLTERKGWPSFEKPIPELISMGASYLLLVNPSAQDLQFGKTYKIVTSNAQYVLFDLHQKP